MSSVPKPQTIRYTVADYMTWPDEERWELIDGVPYNMSSALVIKHQNIAGRIYSRLEQKLRGKSSAILNLKNSVMSPGPAG